MTARVPTGAHPMLQERLDQLSIVSVSEVFVLRTCATLSHVELLQVEFLTTTGHSSAVPPCLRCIQAEAVMGGASIEPASETHSGPLPPPKRGGCGDGPG